MNVIDIEQAKIVNPTLGNDNIIRLIRLPVQDKSGHHAFAACTTNGQLRVYTEGTGEMSKWIEKVATYKAHQGQVSDVMSMPNGTLITCGDDRAIAMWEERGSNSKCTCCNIF